MMTGTLMVLQNEVLSYYPRLRSYCLRAPKDFLGLALYGQASGHNRNRVSAKLQRSEH